MVHDYWMWRDDPAFVRRQLGGTRTVLDWFAARQRPDGLVGRLEWWNFVDWTDSFEAALGEPDRAARYRKQAQAIVDSARRLAWHEGRGLLADAPSRTRFSQQTNILALLAGAAPDGQQKPLLDRVLALPRPSIKTPLGGPPAEVAGASVYFRFYLSRALEALGEGDRYLPELEPWREMLEVGLSTFAEIPSVAVRSDCHAWSAHPNYDLLRTVAGLKPGSPGFATVRIEPHLGTLDTLDASLPHPKGTISVSYRRAQGALSAKVTLPAGLTGEFAWRGLTRKLVPGEQSFQLQ
jgi:hypothetical protein